MMERYYVEEEELVGSLSWSNLENKKTLLSRPVSVFLSPYLSYGDYDNSCAVERSNVRVFLEKFGTKPGVHEVYGGFGSHGVVLTQEALGNEEIKECIAALEDYPVIDDQDMSEMEMEMYKEAWDSWLCADFLWAVEKRIEDQLPEDEVFDADSDEAYKILYTWGDRAGLYFEIESGGNVWLDINRLLENVTDEEIIEWYNGLEDQDNDR